MTAFYKYLIIPATIIFISACGGGGGGGGGSSPSLTVFERSATVDREQGVNETPQVSISGALSHAEDANLFWGASHDSEIVLNVSLMPTSENTFDILITLREPDLDVGSYQAVVEVGFCQEGSCPSHIDNSPQTITITYNIQEPTYPRFSLATDQVEVSASQYDSEEPVARVGLQAYDVSSSSGAHFRFEASSNDIDSYNFSPVQDDPLAGDLILGFKDPGSYYYSDTHYSEMEVVLCLDSGCNEKSIDSPKVISTEYTISEEPNFPPLEASSITSLGFNIVDAEYSDQLDSVVIVSDYPTPGLHRYNVNTNVISSVELALAPVAVSVGPDGLFAAVGHDGYVSYVDLNKLDDGSYVPEVLDVSASSKDIVLAGNGYVYVFPEYGDYRIHVVEIATNTASQSSGYSVYRSLARLHPSGKYIYGADIGISPSDIDKYDIQQGIPSYLYDSPYHGDYAMCGNLWFSESGLRIYTKCGNVFRSSENQSQDMTYAGSLARSNGYDEIVSMADSAEASEVTLIEQRGSYGCDGISWGNSCFSVFRTYEGSYLQPRKEYLLPELKIAGNGYDQRGMFVFYTSNGQSKILLSQAMAMPNPDKEYYLQVISE